MTATASSVMSSAVTRLTNTVLFRTQRSPTEINCPAEPLWGAAGDACAAHEPPPGISLTEHAPADPA